MFSAGIPVVHGSAGTPLGVGQLQGVGDVQIAVGGGVGALDVLHHAALQGLLPRHQVRPHGAEMLAVIAVHGVERRLVGHVCSEHHAIAVSLGHRRGAAAVLDPGPLTPIGSQIVGLPVGVVRRTLASMAVWVTFVGLDDAHRVGRVRRERMRGRRRVCGRIEARTAATATPMASESDSPTFAEVIACIWNSFGGPAACLCGRLLLVDLTFRPIAPPVGGSLAPDLHRFVGSDR